jgi:hypothetical protein
MAAPDALSEIGAVLAPVLAQVPVERHPLLIALAERLAARRYRAWARETGNAELAACAAREEEIATRIEALYPDAAAVQRELLAAHPEVDEINRTLFAGRSQAEQFGMQARGERLGAATWRSFAKRAADPAARAVFLACTALEEESAVCLERLVGGPC